MLGACLGLLPGIGITGGQCFLEYGVITVDIVEKSNLIFLVYRSRAVNNQNRNSRDKVHLKIVFSPFIVAFTRSRSQPGLFRNTQATRSAGFSSRMHPWLKSRMSCENSPGASVPCRYTLSGLGKMIFTRPREFVSPGFCRTIR